jgi:hypothetical protein
MLEPAQFQRRGDQRVIGLVERLVASGGAGVFLRNSPTRTNNTAAARSEGLPISLRLTAISFRPTVLNSTAPLRRWELLRTAADPAP